jgi:predicted NBD/HSP70 family sugar kinase
MYILFDIGGTSIRIAGARSLEATPEITEVANPGNYEAGMELIIAASKRFAGAGTIEAIAGGIAGPLAEDKMSVSGGINIPDWIDKPLVSDLSESLDGVPVYLQNDAALAGLAEAHHGAGVGKRIVAYITVSTGVGGARIVQGVLDENSHGFEPGWQIIDPSNPALATTNENGYLIDLISGAATLRHYGKLPSEIDDSSFWEEQARLLAYGLNNVAVFWSPDIIVLGGGLIVSGRIDVRIVRDHFGRLLNVYSSLPKLAVSPLGDDGGIIGALAYLRQIGR